MSDPGDKKTSLGDDKNVLELASGGGYCIIL